MVLYRLHCLNQLRKLIYPTYYNYSAATLHHPDLWFVHLNHCVDILAQNLMCTANTDMITLQWVETQFYPFPDFNVNHPCRDFDALVDWAAESTVDQTLWKEQGRPKGVKEVPAPRELLDWIAKQRKNANRKGVGVDVSGHDHHHG
jgi:hypothetical protein